QTGCLTHCTVDVHCHLAVATDQVVMVIADPGFVEGGATRWLDPPKNSGSDKGIEIVVNRLARQLESSSRGRDNELGILMLPFRFDDLKHGQSRRGEAQIRLP